MIEEEDDDTPVKLDRWDYTYLALLGLFLICLVVTIVLLLSTRGFGGYE